MDKLKKNKLYKVIWLDASDKAYWLTHDEYQDYTEVKVCTIGYYFKKAKGFYHFYNCFDMNWRDKAIYHISIPIGCVVKIKKL
jgi:hypothetical protein